MHAVQSYQNYVMNKSLTSLSVTQSSLLKKAGAETKYTSKRIGRVQRFYDERVAVE